ncbi:L,D-transpeptidase family protein [Pseudopelagicola sp. nBUS_20]|uniref:L,D-transpeptidase family protein n=1 Tax=Pseudopelagicola sp. nBUS_20 TaxID=3395317 RepID=UPI003EC14022
MSQSFWRNIFIPSFLKALVLVFLLPANFAAAFTAFKQAVAEAAAKDADVARFYQLNNYTSLWTGGSDLDLVRRQALILALSRVENHSLPASRYQLDQLIEKMASANTARDFGFIDVTMTKVFLKYARDVSSGLFVPSQLSDGIQREVTRLDRAKILNDFSVSFEPQRFINDLPPQSPEYTRLMKEKLRLEYVMKNNAWGPIVPLSKLEPGDSGERTVILRNRLIAMGFMSRSATATYDRSVEKAVQNFQITHGLQADGVAGKGTIEEINKSPEARLKSVMVAMERERWFSRANKGREVIVNLTDFTAKIFDDGKMTFRTRSVVGKNQNNRRSPEFSDIMEHMIINPTWNVPRSIATKEYLPMMKKNPNAVSYLRLIDSNGRTISRENLDFSQYDTRNFPFDMKQAPGNRNALGLVKFMFPNKHNIYLHDTPAKKLFKREVRAYSHGCIRLHQPFDFAYTLLEPQEEEPKKFFTEKLNTRRETKVDLNRKIPVHIIYRTAFTEAKGPVQYRRDIYGRDATIWKALVNEGVVLRAHQG